MKVVIAGGGLVGALLARILGQEGHNVHVYEYRDDPRKGTYTHGRSINLALSTRGRAALAVAGLEEAVMKTAIPMRGRMLHAVDGSRQEVLYDPESGQCVYSISRQFLNEILLTEAETCPGVQVHFNHKLVDADFMTGMTKFQKVDDAQELEIGADLVVGADGAHSVMRKTMLRKPMINFSQEYIEHGYLELVIPPNADGKHAMETNYLHIWPRDRFMLIALPNQDGSFTATIFMPFDIFDELNTEKAVVGFFEREFPDALQVMDRNHVVGMFLNNKASALVSIKCNRHHYGKGVLVGDAAHAMVPFYGQGMNAGFEDVLLLDDILRRRNWEDNIERALELYSQERVENARAICDLAMYNYVEMRHHVNQKSYHWRRNVDWALHKVLGDGWIPLYNSVTFTTIPYSQCVQHKKWQDDVLANLRTYASRAVSGAVILSLVFWNRIAEMGNGGHSLPAVMEL